MHDFDFRTPLSPVRCDFCPARREMLVLFSILVAGKGSRIAAPALNRFLGLLPSAATPFAQLRAASDLRLRRAMVVARLGQYTLTEAAFRTVQHFDLSTSQPTVEEWEWVPKIGPKTARMIAVNLDPTLRAAILDVHLLRWLSTLGHPAPKATPQSRPRYLALERAFLGEAERRGVHPRELDLAIWSLSQD